MRKNLVLFIVVICTIFLCNYIVMPKIDYDKIESNSYSKYVTHSFETSEESSSESEKSKVIIAQLVLDYEDYGSIKDRFQTYSDDDYRDKRKDHRKKAKAYHEGNSSNVFKTIKTEKYQEIYVSKYSPYIDITYDYSYFGTHKNEILSELTNNKHVKEVRLIESEVYECHMSTVIDLIDAGAACNNRTTTGEGVVVGILEPSIINTNDDYLEHLDITIRSSGYNVIAPRDHATNIARVIGGTYGLAPGVSILNSYLTGTVNEEMEWMIENNVDIVNMSCGEEENEGYYSTVSAYVDYIAYTYDIIMVASAGNTHDLVTNPGLGYNVITCAASSYYGDICPASAFQVVEGPIKPTISAPASVVSTDGVPGGETGETSAAAAIVSGTIALLLEDYPSLASDKARLIALIVTNAYDANNYEYEEENGFDDDTGGGLINYQRIIDHYNTAFNYTNSSGQANTIFKSRMIYLSEGDNLRAAFASIAKADGTVDGTVFTDYDMYLKDPNGNVVVEVLEAATNVMMLNYIAPSTGYYRVEIRQYSALRDTIDYTGFAYSVY